MATSLHKETRDYNRDRLNGNANPSDSRPSVPQITGTLNAEICGPELPLRNTLQVINDLCFADGNDVADAAGVDSIIADL
jgi:hypothetical protein